MFLSKLSPTSLNPHQSLVGLSPSLWTVSDSCDRDCSLMLVIIDTLGDANEVVASTLLLIGSEDLSGVEVTCGVKPWGHESCVRSSVMVLVMWSAEELLQCCRTVLKLSSY